MIGWFMVLLISKNYKNYSRHNLFSTFTTQVKVIIIAKTWYCHFTIHRLAKISYSPNVARYLQRCPSPVDWCHLALTCNEINQSVLADDCDYQPLDLTSTAWALAACTAGTRSLRSGSSSPHRSPNRQPRLAFELGRDIWRGVEKMISGG